MTSMLTPANVMDIFQFFTLFATDKKHRRIKLICRYQQFEGANLIVNRVRTGYPEARPHLALPGIRKVAAHGVRRTEAAHGPRAQEPDRRHRGRPH
ncbi:MAG: hypothetical protein ACLTSX_12325 [Collinsella sp.]